ncbi:histidinol dehydrogenase [Gammaproteobacteria bacterium]|nr:histidinol dehydrogenase [Gammaproteobacteria bacterium]
MLTFSAIKYEDCSFHERLNSYLDRKNQSSNMVAATVGKIISEVRTNGDIALKSFTKDFDNFDCNNFLISQQEFEKATNDVDHELIESLEFAFENISNYQSKCYESLNLEPPDDDVKRKFRVIDSVGMYIPGGQASYPSTVLMAAAPALACGVRDISLTTPARNGILNSLTIAAAKVAGVNKIYKIGGAQAIAALALGTDQVSKVDKIIGPGNAFVAEAKKQLFGEVGIDSIAGPSEIVILADDTSDPETIAWDLMAQSEHDSDASAVMISSSDKLIDEVKKIINKEIVSLQRHQIIKDAIESNGLFISINDLGQAKEIINRIAPEHLHIAFDHNHYKEEGRLVAGLIMKGKDSAISLSDYVLGPSHILPTNSSSRFSSPLSVEDFLISYSYVSLNKNKDINQFKEYVDHTSKIARAEGLTAHAIAAEKRLNI